MNYKTLNRRGLLRCLAVATVILVLPSIACSEIVYSTTFPEPADSLPADWTVAAGAVGPPSGWRTTGADFRYDASGTGIAYYAGSLIGGGSSTAMTDFTVETELRKTPGGNIAGVVARFQDTSNFYHARLEGTNELEIYRFAGGSATKLGATVIASDTYDSGETWRLKLSVVGSRLIASLYNQNDTLVGWMERTDGTFTSGSAGLRATSPAAYETFSINKIPEPSTVVMLAGLAGVGLLGGLWRRRRGS